MIAQQLVDILKPDNKSFRFNHVNVVITINITSVYEVDKLVVTIDRREYDLPIVQLIPIDTTNIDVVCEKIVYHVMDIKSIKPITLNDVKFNLLNIKDLS